MRENAAADGFQAEHQAGECRAGEDEAAPVEGVAAGFADVVDVEGDQDDAEDADGNVDVENGAPGEIIDDEAADRRAEDGAEQGGGGEPGHGGDQLAFWHGAQEDQAADRDHHGAAHALEDAGGDEFAERVRLAAEDRAKGEDDDGQAEDVLGAEAVGDPAAGGDEHRECQEVGGQGDVHVHGFGAEGARHGRQGGGDDGAVEVLHEEGAGDDQRGDAGAPAGAAGGGGGQVHCASFAAGGGPVQGGRGRGCPAWARRRAGP